MSIATSCCRAFAERILDVRAEWRQVLPPENPVFGRREGRMPDWLDGTYQAFTVVSLLVGFALSVWRFLAGVHALWRDPRHGPTATRRTLLAVGAYLLSSGFMVAFVVALTGGHPCPDAFAIPAVALILLWIGFSLVWLLRLLPQTPLPGWVARPFGWLDWVLLAGIVAALVAALTARSACG
jgi:hypothetical protein